jgi:hypothetical protein
VTRRRLRSDDCAVIRLAVAVIRAEEGTCDARPPALRSGGCMRGEVSRVSGSCYQFRACSRATSDAPVTLRRALPAVIGRSQKASWSRLHQSAGRKPISVSRATELHRLRQNAARRGFHLQCRRDETAVWVIAAARAIRPAKVRQRMLHDGEIVSIMTRFRGRNRSLIPRGGNGLAVRNPCRPFYPSSRTRQDGQRRRSGGRSLMWIKAARLDWAVRAVRRAGRFHPQSRYRTASALRPPWSCVIPSLLRFRSTHRPASRGDNGCICA